MDQMWPRPKRCAEKDVQPAKQLISSLFYLIREVHANEGRVSHQNFFFIFGSNRICERCCEQCCTSNVLEMSGILRFNALLKNEKKSNFIYFFLFFQDNFGNLSGTFFGVVELLMLYRCESEHDRFCQSNSYCYVPKNGSDAVLQKLVHTVGISVSRRLGMY